MPITGKLLTLAERESYIILLKRYFSLKDHEYSFCYNQAVSLANLIFYATENNKLYDINKIFGHSFICSGINCSALCRLFNIVACHVNKFNSFHDCALRFIFTKFASLHFDTCLGNCQIPNCHKFRTERREIKIQKMMENVSLSDN